MITSPQRLVYWTDDPVLLWSEPFWWKRTFILTAHAFIRVDLIRTVTETHWNQEFKPLRRPVTDHYDWIYPCKAWIPVYFPDVPDCDQHPYGSATERRYWETSANPKTRLISTLLCIPLATFEVFLLFELLAVSFVFLSIHLTFASNYLFMYGKKIYIELYINVYSQMF